MVGYGYPQDKWSLWHQYQHLFVNHQGAGQLDTINTVSYACLRAKVHLFRLVVTANKHNHAEHSKLTPRLSSYVTRGSNVNQSMTQPAMTCCTIKLLASKEGNCVVLSYTSRHC